MDFMNNNHGHCWQAKALLLLRLTLGSIFFLHGSQKVFGFFGGPGLDGFIAWMGTIGVTPFWGYMAAFAEFLGGCLMFLGIATEVGAFLTIPVMVGAVVLVHWQNGYFMQHGGFEYPFNLILLALAVMIGGPGKCALWDPFKKWRQ